MGWRVGRESPKKEPGVLYYVRLSAIACMATRLILQAMSNVRKNRLVSRADLGEGELCLEALGPRGRQVRKVLRARACSRISATCHLGTSSSTLFRDLRLSDDFHVVSYFCFYGSILLLEWSSRSSDFFIREIFLTLA